MSDPIVHAQPSNDKLEISFPCELTLQEMREGQVALVDPNRTQPHETPKSNKTKVFWWLLVAAIVVLQGLLHHIQPKPTATNIERDSTARANTTGSIVGATAIGLGVAGAVAGFLLMKAGTDRVSRDNLSSGRWILREECIQRINPGIVESWDWAAFMTLVEFERSFVLRQSVDVGFILAKQQIGSAAEVQRARDFLNRKIPRQSNQMEYAPLDLQGGEK